MRPAVRAAFVGFTSPMEGVVPWLYLDVRGLVTTAIGNLVDPVAYAITLPFMRPDGSPASREEIAEEWNRVKLRQDMKDRGGGAFRMVTSLRLTPDGISEVVMRKLAQMDQHLRMRFAGYDDWPADAQLGALSMAWALGAGFSFPMFNAALKARDFILASHECGISTVGNPGVAPRNASNRVLFRNAAFVVSQKLDPDAMYWPKDLYGGPDTEPELPKLREPGDSEPPEFHPAQPVSIVPDVNRLNEAMQDLRLNYKKDDEEK